MQGASPNPPQHRFSIKRHSLVDLCSWNSLLTCTSYKYCEIKPRESFYLSQLIYSIVFNIRKYIKNSSKRHINVLLFHQHQI